MSTKSMRPPPRRTQCHNSNSTTGSSNNNNNIIKEKRKKKEEEGSEGRKSEILAGYQAHEFLTKGTVLGRRWDQRLQAQHDDDKYEIYVQLAGLLKTDGPHLSGLVNPTQLARYLHLFNS